MSKELEAWEDIKWYCYKEGKLDKQFDIIETAIKALKDIEEELGIDLITLIKVLKDKKVWIIYVNHISRFYITDINIETGIIVGDINISKSACFEKTYNIKDYGKTWALTKEELEDE